MKRIPPILFLALLLLLAACAGGTSDDPAAIDRQEFDGAVDRYETDLDALVDRFDDGPAARALAADGGAAFEAELAAFDPGADAPPTGVFDHDPASGAFVPSGEASEDLVHRWTTDADEEVESRVAWTEGADGALAGATLTLRVDGELVGETEVATAHAHAACPHPTRVEIDGFVGTDVTATAEDVTFEAVPDRFAASGAIALADDADRAELEWDLRLDGAFYGAEACEELAAPSVTGGHLGFATRTSVDGATTSFAAEADVEDVVVVGGTFVSATVDGFVDVDGARAVSFAGTLNDADGDGTLGDDLVLTFDDGETVTLETILADGAAATALRVAGAFLR